MAGIITELKLQKRNTTRVSLFLDGRFVLGLPAIVAAPLKVGQYLPDADLRRLEEEADIEEAHDRALGFLSYRPRSIAEVSAYLRGRGFAEEEVDAVTARLVNAGLLNDEAFVRFWIDNRERFRPRGPQALRYELRQKGVSDELIEKALSDVDVLESAYRAAEKKALNLGRVERPVFRRKLVEHLVRRGFGYDVAQETAERCWAEIAAGELSPASQPVPGCRDEAAVNDIGGRRGKDRRTWKA